MTLFERQSRTELHRSRFTIDNPTPPYAEFTQAGVNIIGPGDGMICRRLKTFDEAKNMTARLNGILDRVRVSRYSVRKLAAWSSE